MPTGLVLFELIIFNLFLAPIPLTLFMSAALTPKSGKIGTVALRHLVMVACANLPAVCYPMVYIKPLVFCLSILLGVSICYCGTLGRKLFVVFLALAGQLICEVFTGNVLLAVLQGSSISELLQNATVLPAFMAMDFVSMMFFAYVGTICIGRYVVGVPHKIFLPFSILPLIQLLSIYCVTLLLADNGDSLHRIQNLLWVLMIVILSIVADALMLWTIRAAAKVSSTEAENQNLLKTQQLHEEHYAALSEQREQLQKMRHDILNHIETMNGLLGQGENELAKQCNRQLLTDYRRHIGSVGYCAHRTIDMVIYNKISYAATQHIQTAIQVIADATLPIRDIDLISLFSNILDNAIAACLLCDADEPKFIELSATTECGFFAIKETNSKPVENTAKQGEHHGLGLQIVRELAQRYSGTLTTESHGNTFTVIVTLSCASGEKNH